MIGDEFTLANLQAKFKEIMSMNVKPSTNTNLLNVKFDWQGNMIDKTTGNVVEDTESIHSWEYLNSSGDTSDSSGTGDSSDTGDPLAQEIPPRITETPMMNPMTVPMMTDPMTNPMTIKINIWFRTHIVLSGSYFVGVYRLSTMKSDVFFLFLQIYNY